MANNVANTLNLTNICNQRRQQMLFNIPPSRNELQKSPYIANATQRAYTQQELNMRRKTEILKYSSNVVSTQTNLLTRKEKWAKISNARYNGNILFCPNDDKMPTPTSGCDVPGPITLLVYDPTVPLYNFATKTISYGILNGNDTVNWSTLFNSNVKVDSNTETSITSLYIKNNENILRRKFNIKTPFCVYIAGVNIPSTNGSFDVTLNITTINTTIYYGIDPVASINGNIPTYSFSTQNTPIRLTLRPPENSTTFNYSAFVYSGILNLNNINLQTENGYIYDIKIQFISAITTTNSNITNNSAVFLYTNLSDTFNDSIKNNINPLTGTPLAYNCTINSGISTDSYSSAALGV